MQKFKIFKNLVLTKQSKNSLYFYSTSIISEKSHFIPKDKKEHTQEHLTLKTQVPAQVAIDYLKLTDGEIIDLMLEKKLSQHKLEEVLGDKTRSVKLRRMYSVSKAGQEDSFLDGLPYEGFDYEKVYGVCCENVIGYIPLPVGLIGPLKIDGKDYNIPLATVEGCLVASAQRGCNALNARGVNAVIVNDGMTRGPVVAMPSAKRAGELKQWIQDRYSSIEKEFNSTSNFARLQRIQVAVAGRKAFLRFSCRTGDAMGMNMITKAVTKAMIFISDQFPDMNVISVSGNYCTDKKPSAINWIEGRGKSVVVDSVVPHEVVKSILKTNVDDLVKLNIDKNLIGSAMAGSIGGFNAHASNIVTAVYLACGQDAAQNVESSTCMTLMEKTEDGDLYISCTMPSIEVGTVGGGTHLNAQATCLNIIGVRGAHEKHPGLNAQNLAKVVAGAVMAGELSLMSALASGDLLKSHMKLNRKK